eukprot:jgi/Chrpa1/17387/Chrysochromulina_OHIO_Genome00021549-RA
MLTGIEAGRIASTCRAFAHALAPEEIIWQTFYSTEFVLHPASDALGPSWKRRYEIALQRIGLRRARWHTRGPWLEAGDGVGSRQGASSCAFSLATQGCFCVYGGWTDEGISRDLHVLRRRSSGEGVGAWRWSLLVAADVASHGPRCSYGPTITAVPDAGGQSVRLLVLGGVTAGGYRGAVGTLRTVLVAPAEDASGADGLPDLAARWVAEGSVDGRPRAYHSATLVPAGSAAHPSNQHKLWVFGGFNDHTPGRRLASLDVYDIASRAWDPALVNGRLYVCGGCTDTSNMKPGEGGQELSDVWLLDTTKPSGELAWVRISPPGVAPSGALQRCHGAASLADRILFFGGGRSNSLTNHVCAFDTSSGTWCAGPQQLHGQAPRSRQNASCAMMPGTGVLVVFGGWRIGNVGQDVLLGDTCLLDLDDPWVSDGDQANGTTSEHMGDVEEDEEEDEEVEVEDGAGVGGPVAALHIHTQ